MSEVGAPARPDDVSLESVENFFTDYCDTLRSRLQEMRADEILAFAQALLRARAERRQIFLLGNGGSAANASHFTNDLTKERFPDPASLFRALSLTDCLPWITATANDFGYDLIFVQQLKNLLQPGDMVVAVSSSGNSPNVIKAVEYANDHGAVTYAIVGFSGGELSQKAQYQVYIPTKKGQYGFMEDATSIIFHAVSIFIQEQDRRTLQSSAEKTQSRSLFSFKNGTSSSFPE